MFEEKNSSGVHVLPKITTVSKLNSRTNSY